jgi:glycosyltransferase involved in cell wall biosynthesis
VNSLANSDIKILLSGPITSNGGYGGNARCWVQALHSQGYDIRIQPFNDYNANYQFNPQEQAFYQSLLYDQKELFVPDLLFNVSNPIGYQKKNVKQVCSTAWETDKVHTKFAEGLSTQDLVTVQSQFNLPLVQQFNANTKVVPLGVDLKTFYPEKLEKNADEFVFVSNGKWEYRKNFRNLLVAFEKAFGGNRKVKLLIKTHLYGGVTQEDITRVISENAPKANIQINLHDIPTSHMRQLYNIGDVFVLPTRGEGFGIPFLEAMACGRPVIAPTLGGHRQFVDESNALLVKSRPQRIIPHGPYGPGMNMIESDVNDLCEKLKYAYHNRDAMKKLSEGALNTAKGLSIENVGKMMSDAINPVVS